MFTILTTFGVVLPSERAFPRTTTQTYEQAPETQAEQGLAQTQSAPGSSDTKSSGEQPARRALPAPLDGIVPGSEYLGPTPLIGVPDTDPVYPLTKALWSIFPTLKTARIKVYGWADPALP